MKRVFDLLFSSRLMAMLFIVFAVAMGVATFIENDFGTQTSKVLVYNTWWFELIMLLFCVNFFGNIFRYKLYRKEKWAVLAFHLSFILILVGAGVTRYFSFEGIMPIEEGESTNVFFSETTYFDFTVDNKKVQRPPKSIPLMLSAWGKNNFSVKEDFKGTPVELKLTNYIPYAFQEFVEDDQGTEYIHFVESSSGSRHDHYIPKGTLQNIHGVLVGFEADDNQTTVNFIQSEEGLIMKSANAGTFLRMADQFEGEVKANEYEVFNYLSLHRIGELSFVVPKPPLSGKMVYQKGNKEENPMDLLQFNLTVGNETMDFDIMGGQYNMDPATKISFNGLNFQFKYGARLLELPFNVKLRDFQLERYPGSQSAMSYASEVTVIDPEETFDFRIYMNNILNYKGYKFFQSSYDISGPVEETRLSVNHDFWGTTITYAGYMILYVGLMLIMFVKNTRFDMLRNKLDKIKVKKAALTAVLAVFALQGSYAQHEHQEENLKLEQIQTIVKSTIVDKSQAEAFGELVIQDGGGRMKPVNTFSSELLRKVSKSDTYLDYNADQIFLSIIQNPGLWYEVPVIYLERGNDKIRTLVGIDVDRKYAALSDFIDDQGNYKITDLVEEAQKKNVRSKFEKDLINVDKRVGLLYSAIGGGILKIFPVPSDSENKWISLPEFNESRLSGSDSVFVRQVLPVYVQTLQQANKTGNYADATEILDGMKNFQKKYGAEVYPSQEKIDLEIAYNKYDVFKKLFSYYMYVGTLMFLLVIIQIFKNNKALNVLIKICVGIIALLFLMHTGGLIARWFVSGHAPWSNAYESMIYVAWATMLFGFLFGKNSTLTIAATAFLTSMILMIAHWNWMDPEIANLQPVLNSYWLMIHVAIIVASYGPFALSMIVGIIALLLIVLTNEKNKKKVKLNIDELTTINEMAMTLGLILLTIGNFLGGMWANESWGRYWGWDPKETWALISIFVYAFVLHLRLIPGLKSKFTFNLWSIIAFASIMMTYFGVNFYLSGLHAYASGDKVVTPYFVYISVLIVAILGIAAKYKFNRFYKKK